ncbi:hypothetical protein [Azorhizobium]|uniref:Uncharacterized protein n=1 Tax=Azorhizobium caulinodans (strain ATCC 43989 / DSM 5975 / JCM 20966 / LMG 6465 / NBRC 14845 / NCIMB 13405 / ORS 571) TaxID=438753 RepID=A8IC38_AZOC5|nr:hypothetical protein [Azorhizobium]TDT93609.1 hypothetical protein DFO45_2987 [Azorhizobium sp. AG788]BAF89154.1 unknown protein [Azorhizobium caulinodans ORS 571]
MTIKTIGNVVHLPAPPEAPQAASAPIPTSPSDQIYAQAVDALSDYRRLAAIPELSAGQKREIDLARDRVVEYLCLARAIARIEQQDLPAIR